MKNIRILILIAIFVSISYIGALIKLPGPMSTVALDSFTGYLGGLVLGATYGGFIAIVAHLFVSMTSGFPLSVPIHIAISIMMFISVFSYTKISKKYNFLLGTIAGTLINGVIMPLLLMILPLSDKGFYISLIPILIVASITNIVLSNFIYGSIKKIIPHWINE